MVLNALFRRVAALVMGSVVAACTYVPFDAPRDVTRSDVVDGVTLSSDQTDNGGSRYYQLVDGRDALGARLQLIETARHSLDISTFLIKTDTAGRLFAAKLIEAAERGVRVRFLIDDVFTTSKDHEIALLDQHPNIEVRVFNPASRLAPKPMGFVLDFGRVNRRMHNKVFVVDNRIAILGGRNIANEYYQLDASAVFADFEILTIGKDSAKLGATFDTFWNDPYAVPIDALLGSIDRARIADDISEWKVETSPEEDAAYRDAVTSPYINRIRSGEVAPYRGKAWIKVDPPEKLRNVVGLGPHDIANALFTAVSSAKSEVVLLTPYFVPEDYGVQIFSDLVARGVRVRIVTNSLAATNHPYVHGGYLPYRKRLLEAGVELYEVRADVPALLDDGNNGDAPTKLTMHSKMGVIDNDQVFVGSLNLDPRSIRVNTEIGMVISSPRLARDMLHAINSDIHEYTYRVGLDDDQTLVWDYFGFGKNERRLSEPQATGFQKFMAHFTKMLGVEILL